MGAGEFLCNVQPVSTGYPISSAGWDYNLVRWLEREGYYVTYVTNVDAHDSPGLFERRLVFIAGAPSPTATSGAIDTLHVSPATP